MHVNKVLLIGRVTTAGPKISWNDKGAATYSFWLQVDEPGKDGAIYSTYLPVEITGKHAEDVAEQLTAGDEVYIDGKLKYKTTIGKDGDKRGSVIVTSWFVTRAPTPLEVVQRGEVPA